MIVGSFVFLIFHCVILNMNDKYIHKDHNLHPCMLPQTHCNLPSTSCTLFSLINTHLPGLLMEESERMHQFMLNDSLRHTVECKASCQVHNLSTSMLTANVGTEKEITSCSHARDGHQYPCLMTQCKIRRTKLPTSIYTK